MKKLTLWLNVLAISTLLIVFLGLGGCKPAETAVEEVSKVAEEEAPPAEEEEVAEEVTEITEPVEIMYWSMLDPEGDDPRGRALKNIVNSFNESHPDIHVSVEPIHWTKIDAMLIQATAVGGGPDLIQIYTDQLPMHVESGTIIPLNQFADEWLKELGSDYTFPISEVTYNSEIMAIPWEIRVFNLWYRQDVLESAGLELPKTLDELAMVGGELRKASGNEKIGLALSFSEKNYGAQFMETFFTILWAYGGQMFGENGEVTVASEAGVAAMEWMKKAVNEYGVIGREGLNLTADDVTNGFKAGTILMTIAGSMRVATAREAEGIGDNLQTTTVPGLTPDEPSPCKIAGQTIVMGSNIKNPKAAWQFIEHFLSLESQLEMSKAGVMPVIASAFDDPIISESPNGEEMKSWMEYARKYGRMERYPSDYNQLAEILAKASQEIVYNNAPIKETLEQAVADYNMLKK